ncbi:MAG: SDR family oxidoreductase [Leptospiraceae bacterium]|nr:SDR family oxidoreductase [Leptospiraceae bacterium]MCP5499951.1 SDR family oxidoreductase [Leptospiraceae bacterium]
MNRVALITGASVGIGYELALLFARDKHDLILVARREDKLKELAEKLIKQYGIQVFTIASDLSRPSSPSEIYAEVKKQGIFVEYLINNAGFGTNGEFHQIDIRKELSLIQVNISSLIELSHLFLQDMIAQNKGAILNVASTAAFQPGPYMANYYASKAYVLHFTEAIAEELKKYNISISALCPGPTKTEFFDAAGMQALKLPLMSAEVVALKGYKALKGNSVISIPGLINKLGVLSVRFSPRFLVRKIAGLLNKSK